MCLSAYSVTQLPPNWLDYLEYNVKNVMTVGEAILIVFNCHTGPP